MLNILYLIYVYSYWQGLFYMYRICEYVYQYIEKIAILMWHNNNNNDDDDNDNGDFKMILWLLSVILCYLPIFIICHFVHWIPE